MRIERPLLFENVAYDVYLQGADSANFLTMPDRRTARFHYSDEAITHYQLRYDSAVGDVRWRWEVAGHVFDLELEVFPSKLEYRTDFAQIKADLERISHGLLADLRGATALRTAHVPSTTSTTAEWVSSLRSEARHLEHGMRSLLPRLREQVTCEPQSVPSDRIRARSILSRSSASRLAAGSRPRHVDVRSKVLSRSTTLNGHLRWEIETFLSTARRVVSGDWLAAVDDELSELVRAMVKEADTWRRELQDVKPVASVPHLQTRLRDPLYGRVFSSLRRLRSGLAEADSSEFLGLKDIALLYELWAYLKVTEVARRRFPIVVAGTALFMSAEGDGFRVARGEHSKIVLSDDRGRMIATYFNRNFGSLPTTNQKPDIVVESGGILLVVDAKYRVGRSSDYLKKFGSRGPEEDDINVLHRYRDAIVNGEGERLVSGGIIVFPELDETTYRAHHFYKCWPIARIAGAPLLPGATTVIEELLADAVG